MFMFSSLLMQFHERPLIKKEKVTFSNLGVYLVISLCELPIGYSCVWGFGTELVSVLRYKMEVT